MSTQIESAPCLSCYMCGNPGGLLYGDLRDQLFGVPGRWNVRQCLREGCGLMWLDPLPSQHDIAQAYTRYFTHEDINPPNTWARKARLYVKSKHEHLTGGGSQLSLLERLVALLAYLHPVKRAMCEFPLRYLQPMGLKGRLLDVGFGRTDILEQMRSHGWWVEGVDFDSIAVDNARRKGFNVRLGSLADQAYPDGSFDAIVASHVIEHIHDPLGFLKECYRILHEGGILLIATPNPNSTGHAIFRANWVNLDPPRHLQIFTHQALKELARRAGFFNTTISTTVRTTAYTFAASRSICRLGQVPERLSRSERFYGFIAAAWQQAWLSRRPLAGEELLLQAYKK